MPGADAKETSQVGKAIGNYKVVQQIGEGGMGVVYMAEHPVIGRKVAIKLLHASFARDSETVARFFNEARAIHLIAHPNIVEIMDFGQTADGQPYFIMEFLQGQSLADRIARGPMSPTDAVAIVTQICDALQAAHDKNIVHRDLKPQNIMVCDDGSIRILDFGIAKAARMRRLTFAGFSPTMGTPDYMAPEQVNGRRGDQRTDIYSLGAILYEMVTGKVPFEGESPYVVMNVRTTGDPVAPRKLNEHLTPVMEEIILHALARNPDDRYANAALMKAELDDYEIVPLIGRYRTLEPVKPWKNKFKTVPLIIAFVAAQVLLFGLMLWYFTHHGKH